MVKRMNPGLFTVMQNKEVAGRRCQMVGNCFLLDIPDKVAVVVHRRYSEEDLRRLREEWLACGERGGVLVSAAISTKELKFVPVPAGSFAEAMLEICQQAVAADAQAATK